MTKFMMFASSIIRNCLLFLCLSSVPASADSGYFINVELTYKNDLDRKYDLKTILSKVDSDFFGAQSRLKTAYLGEIGDFLAVIRGNSNCTIDNLCPTIVYHNYSKKESYVVIFAGELVEFSLRNQEWQGLKVGTLRFYRNKNSSFLEILASRRSLMVNASSK
jgi:hypothetical protein